MSTDNEDFIYERGQLYIRRWASSNSDDLDLLYRPGEDLWTTRHIAQLTLTRHNARTIEVPAIFEELHKKRYQVTRFGVQVWRRRASDHDIYAILRAWDKEDPQSAGLTVLQWLEKIRADLVGLDEEEMARLLRLAEEICGHG